MKSGRDRQATNRVVQRFREHLAKVAQRPFLYKALQVEVMCPKVGYAPVYHVLWCVSLCSPCRYIIAMCEEEPAQICPYIRTI